MSLQKSGFKDIHGGSGAYGGFDNEKPPDFDYGYHDLNIANGLTE